MVISIPVNTTEYIPTHRFPLVQFKYAAFNPVQSAFYKVYDRDANKLLAAATSAGKTLIAEMAIAETIKVRHKQVMFMAPMKALAQEKYEEWTDTSHKFSGCKITIATGDYLASDKRQNIIESAMKSHITIMTSELLDSLTRRGVKLTQWFKKIGLIIVDEAHLLTVEGRGGALECALMRFTQKSDAQILPLSATMTNAKEMAEWISSLNGKDTYLVESQWRPVEIEVTHCPFDDSDGKYSGLMASLEERILSIVDMYRYDKFLIFVHSKNFGRNLIRKLNEMSIKSEFHNADINHEDKTRLVREFEKSDGIDDLVATTTLAWGVNTSAKRVIVANYDASIIDKKQEAGRAGRVGKTDKGYAYLMYPKTKKGKYVDSWNDPRELIIKSRLSNETELAFHIVNEINEGINTYDALWNWYTRSFAVKCGTSPQTLRYVLDDLYSWGIAREQDGVLALSPVGKVAAWFYYSPYAIAVMNTRIRALMENASDLDIACTIGEALPEYPVASEIQREAQRLFKEKELSRNREGNCLAIYLLLTGNQDKKPELTGLIRGIQSDAQRLGAVLKALNGFYKYDYDVSIIEMRLKYGISADLVPLCKIKGIGGVRAQKLYRGGIRNLNDIMKNPEKAAKIINNSSVIQTITGITEELELCATGGTEGLSAAQNNIK